MLMSHPRGGAARGASRVGGDLIAAHALPRTHTRTPAVDDSPLERPPAHSSEDIFSGDSDSIPGEETLQREGANAPPARTLRVNAAFASKFQREGDRRAIQKRIDTLGSISIPRPPLNAFIVAVHHAMCVVGGSARSTRVDELRAAAVVLQDIGMPGAAQQVLQIERDETARGVAAVLAEDGVRTAATQLGSMKPVRASARALVAVARTLHHTGRAVRPELPAPAPGPAGNNKRARPPASEETAAEALAVKRSRGVAMPPTPSMLASEPASTALPASIAAHAPHRTCTAAARKVHGRGAGRGRGLDHHGEPKFEELHPSWQVKRREGRRQAKLVTKALRSAAEPAIEVPAATRVTDDDGGGA